MRVAKFDTPIEVSQERAYEIVDTLTNKIQFENSALKIVWGDSETFGSIYVLIPPLGEAVMLPFAFLNKDS